MKSMQNINIYEGTIVFIISDLDHLPIKGREQKLNPDNNYMYLKSAKVVCGKEFVGQAKPIVKERTPRELKLIRDVRIKSSLRSICKSLEKDIDTISENSNINRSRTLKYTDLSIPSHKVYFSYDVYSLMREIY
jgi:hypothetical protein